MKEDESETDTQAGGTETEQKKLVKRVKRRLRGSKIESVVKGKDNENGKNRVASKQRKRKNILK